MRINYCTSRNYIQLFLFYFRVEGTEFMITCLADSTCEFGMIKRKVLAVAEYLQEPLKCVAS